MTTRCSPANCLGWVIRSDTSLPLSIILWASSRYIDLFFFLKEERLVFSYHQVQEHPKLLLAMTGLNRTEFLQLLSHFQYAWEQYVQQHDVDRDDRQRHYGAGRSEATLVTLEDKLLFILYYVKVYPLQEILAFEFGMVQSTANEWIHILSEVLKQALDHGGYVPARDPKQLGTVLASEAEAT